MNLTSNESTNKLINNSNVVNNANRKEKILILPYNTLRLMDIIPQIEIEKFKNPEWNEPFQKVVLKTISRKVKDLGEYNKLDSKTINDTIEEKWTEYYETAPRTNLYDLCDFLLKQKFITDIIVLFHKNDCHDIAFTNAYYDGSIEELEKFVSENGITCIVMDDIEFLKTLVERGNIDFSYKTIIISRLGYNYYKDESTGVLLMKHMFQLSTKVETMEIGALALTNFDEEDFK